MCFLGYFLRIIIIRTTPIMITAARIAIPKPIMYVSVGGAGVVSGGGVAVGASST